ncbi:hypothetical protein PAXRUDRAFT_379362 [Paxillus rubicundulus Ve08.2h10]|uniref:Uncharacterized protein n=1 Tax=Paxillus rubicundulus Ve08.2h10 TaxID=930991 RepID=A0A0D0C2M9_9AGAM|nr:hypothetical protein PAXRUDRAFT_379362 [Paxillus rubicundulus Ve08.2h10]
MNKVSVRVIRRNNFEDLEHIKNDTILVCCTIVLIVPSEPVLDFRKCFLNWIEVWRVGRQILNMHSWGPRG